MKNTYKLTLLGEKLGSVFYLDDLSVWNIDMTKASLRQYFYVFCVCFSALEAIYFHFLFGTPTVFSSDIHCSRFRFFSANNSLRDFLQEKICP